MQEVATDLPLSYLLSIERRHWQHNHRISTSINYLICKKLMVDARFEFQKYQTYVNQVDQFANALLKVPHQRVIVGSWLNTLIFNVAALNDEYQEELSHSLSVQSHQSQDVSIEVLDNLHQSQKQCLTYLLNASSLDHIVKSIKGSDQAHTVSHRELHQMQYALLTTIRYLCDKMGIKVKYQNRMGEKLVMLNECPCECCQNQIDQKVRETVNVLLFGKDKQNNFDAKGLQKKLNSNYNASLISITSLIDANFYEEQTKRVLFNGCMLNGAQMIQSLASSFLGSYSKNQLFSEPMLQADRLFQLLICIVEYRHLNVYAAWAYLLNNYLHNRSQSKEQQLITSICNFLYSLLTEHEEFTILLRYMAGQLIEKCKFNESITTDLMKKFMLNRFLLNPVLYYIYNQNQVGEVEFGVQINKIRLLFYPKKSALKQSEQIEAIFSRIIYRTGDKGGKERHHNKNVVYHLDQSLKRDYQSIYCDLFEQYLANNDRNHSSQISFSFVKNNSSREGLTTNRKQQRTKNIQMTPKTNININLRHEIELNSTTQTHLNEKNINQLASPKSQKSTKTVHTQLTDVPPSIDTEMAMIQELVDRRRMLGVTRRAIDHRIAKKAKERQKLRYYFNETHNRFEYFRRQIEKNVNQVRLDIELL